MVLYRRKEMVIASLIIIITIATLALSSTIKNIFVDQSQEIVEETLARFIQFDYYKNSSVDLGGQWKYKIDSYRNGTRKGYYEPGLNLTIWKQLEIPFLWAATVSNDTIWLIKEFELSKYENQRARLVFKGAWLIADVWLNGGYLGSHEGYFSPFYFDITDHLEEGKNILAVCLRSPVELELQNKIHIEGVYNDWDCKPYPNWALGQLVNRDWFTPIGLWREVEIALSGQVTVDLALIKAQIEGEEARAEVTLRVSNRGDKGVTAAVQVEVSGYNFDEEPVMHSFDMTLAPREKETTTQIIDIDNPRVWWPWDQGAQNLYNATVKVYVDDELQGYQKLRFGIRKVDMSIARGVNEWRINDRRVFLRGGNYISDFNLSKSDKSKLSNDLDMFREANINFVRVHAHIEPFEFYQATDELGILVMSDGPFIFAYANDVSSEEMENFETNAQQQIIEMVYLLYNNPSIVLWNVHNEPPWISPWMGDLYNARLNREIDLKLHGLVRNLDPSRPALPSSGDMDEHLYNGWYNGRWEEYKTLAPGFPTEFGAQSLPNAESPFWDALNITWPPMSKELSELIYRDYQSWQWENIGIGPPTAYPNLRTYIEASQEYQSILLKTAIERFRSLKYNNLGGMALFMLTDCHPAVTWSIIDYYRIPKDAYYIVKNVYNPTHVLIDWKGEYEIRDKFKIFYTSNSTLEFDLYIVNDLPRVFENTTLRWRLVDLTSNETLLQEEISGILVPDGESQPLKARNVIWNIPAFTDADHSIILETFLLTSNGNIIDRNNVSFTVEAASQILVTAKGSGAVPDVKFSVIVDGSQTYYVETNASGMAKLTLPGGRHVAILGPVLMGTSRVYVPLYLDLGAIKPGGMVPVSLELIPGAMIRVLANIPPVEGEEPLKLLLTIIPQTSGWNASWISTYGSLSPYMLYLINATGDIVVVPADTPVIIRVTSDNSEILGPSIIDNDGKPFNLKNDEQLVTKTLAKTILGRNDDLTRDVLSETVKKIEEAERHGLYVALEIDRLRYVNETLAKASYALSRDEVFVAAYHLKEAYSVCQNIISELDRLQSESATSLPLLMLVLLFTGSSVASLCTDKKGDQLIFTSLFLSAILVLLYYTYPGFRYATVNDYVTVGYVVFLVTLVLSLGGEFFGNVRSVGGVSLIPAIVVSSSLAIRNMKRRKLRTILILTSVTIMVIGFTWLTTVSTVISTREIKVTPLMPFTRTNLVIASRIDEPLNYDDITWMAAQPEVKGIAVKAQSMPRRDPFGYIGTPPFEIRGIIGITIADPNIQTISNIVSPQGSLDSILTLSKNVLISKNLVEKTGVEVGDRIVVAGAKLEVAGFFDPDRIAGIKDIDDVVWLPEKVNPLGEIEFCTGDEIVITNTYTAAELGAVLTKAYIQTSESQSKDLAMRLSLLSSYYTKAYPRTDVAYLYVASSIVMQVTGSLMIVPLVLVILNIAAVMMAGIYGRRKEISILSMVGLNPSHITYIFLAEALIVGLTGGGIGYLIGIVTFKVLSLMGIYVPTDVKASSGDMVTIIGLTIFTTILSYLAPALKASTLATPSLLRRWKLEGIPTVAGIWSTNIPAKIPPKKVESFVDHLCKRMKEEETGLEIAMSNISQDTQMIDGYPVYHVYFRYSRGGSRPFTSDAKVTVKRSNGDFTISLDCRPISTYPRFAETYVHEVTSYVRKLALEWVSFGSRMLVPLSDSTDLIIRLIKVYNPQLVWIVSRRTVAPKRPILEVEQKLRNQGLLIPAMQLSTVEGKEIKELVRELSTLAREVDIICTDSDDGLLSIAMTIAGLNEKKRLCYFIEERLVEESTETFMQLMSVD